MLSVIVPTYRRPDDLLRCLTALRLQRRPAEETIVIARADDAETLSALAKLSQPVRVVCVERPGQVAALNAGLRTAQGDVVAVTDDDAAPRADWLLRIERHFTADPRIGAVGGRDITPSEPADRAVVGRIQWFGRVIGNHHRGVGAAREVDVLKGVNMSFRRDALRGIDFDARLRGSGAQVHNDLAICLAVKRAGWRILYDPGVAVDHFVAPAADAGRRGSFLAATHQDETHNQTLTLCEHLPATRRVVFLAWALLVGTRAEPGFGHAILLAMRAQPDAIVRFHATLAGRLAGVQTFRSSRRVRTIVQRGHHVS